MAGKRIKHFIFSRFFPRLRPNYPYDILDVDFLSKQLPLTKNVLRSLENQTNENFELIFVLHPNFFLDPKYEFIFSTLKDSTTLPIKFMEYSKRFFLHLPKSTDPELKSSLFSLVEEATNKYDFVITTKMDFDDFIYKNAVEEAQNKINECETVLLYGYNTGYQYVSTSHELYTHISKYSLEGHHSIFQSLILKSEFAKKLPYCTVDNFSHTKAGIELKEFLEINGVEFSENMFQESAIKNAYIYFRHEYSCTILIGHGGKVRGSGIKREITSEYVTKKQLEEEFGFTGYELKSIK